MSQDSGNYLIGRQPILDRNEQLYGHEILFRDPLADVELVGHTSATARVIVNTLSEFGVVDMLGSHKGFVNFDTEMLMSDSLEILPQDRIVIELLETITPSQAIIDRCRYLKKAGFTLSLDDHEYSPDFEELYNIVDIVKIDLLQTPLEKVPAMLEQFRKRSLIVLAEKVETNEVFDACRALGFEFFQGYYFAKPSILRKKSMGEDGITMLKLMRLLSEDSDINDVERVFHGSPVLAYKLLFLVNSVVFRTRQKIQTIRHAIAMLGRRQLLRWVQLALFAGEGIQGLDHPLIELAAVRGGMMEQMARLHPVLRNDPEAPERAFMIGILSLMDRIFDLDMEKILKNINLDDKLVGAIVARQGHYGQLLLITEMVEECDLRTATDELARLTITTDAMMEIQMKAFEWRKGL